MARYTLRQLRRVFLARGPRAVQMDLSRRARRVFRVSDVAGVRLWLKAPNRFDIIGVDYPRGGRHRGRRGRQRKITSFMKPFWLKGKGNRSGNPLFRLTGEWRRFYERLASIWHPIKARAFTVKLRAHAKKAGRESVGFHELWEAVGEHIDKTLSVGENFRQLKHRIDAILGRPLEALEDLAEHIKDVTEEEWRRTQEYFERIADKMGDLMPW